MIDAKPKIFLFAAMLLVLALGLVTLLEHQKEWKRLQRQYDHQEQAVNGTIAIKKIVPSLTKEPELCLTCHLGIEEISPSHPVDAFGCVVCHGGDGRYVDKQAAHRGLIGGRNPSDLRVVEQGCGGRGELAGKCHSHRPDWEANHILRVKKSLQATYASGIHLVRYSFGLDTMSLTQYGIANILEDSIHSDTGLSDLNSYFVSDSNFTNLGNIPRPDTPIDNRFRASCLQEGGCHHWSQGKRQEYFYRATGCSGCHSLYAPDGRYQGKDAAISQRQPGHAREHRLTVAIPYWQCNHCHNRGIYDLRNMNFLLRQDLPISAYATEEEQRRRSYYQPISQYAICEIELDCIDCHSYRDVMGDGDIHARKMDVVEIHCATCHGTVNSLPETWEILDENDFLFTLARTNPNLMLTKGEKLILSARHKPLLNIRQEGETVVVISKVTGRRLPVPLIKGSRCTQKIDEQEAHFCHACHNVNSKSLTEQNQE